MRRIIILASIFPILLLVLSLALLPPTSGTATLQLDVMDSLTGASPPQSVQIYVGVDRADDPGVPTLGNIHPIEPQGAASNEYTVPSQTRVGIFVVFSGKVQLSKIVTLEHDETLVLQLPFPVTP